MNLEEFKALKEGDVVTYNDTPLSDIVEYTYWGSSRNVIKEIRKIYPKGHKFQVYNCAQVEQNWWMLLAFSDGIISDEICNRPQIAVSQNLCICFDKI